MTADSFLLRQAHPNFMKEDLPTSQVFMPNSEDQGQMSAYDGDQISASDAYAHYTKTLGKQSHSVWSITKGEADGHGVPASPDPIPDSPSHAKVDFSPLPEKRWRPIAKKLKALALARGCQFKPASS